MERKDTVIKTKLFFDIGDFWSGIGSIFGIAGGYYDYDMSQYSDAEALKSDAEAVASDMWDIINAWKKPA